jgi:hypothetical protein
MKLEYFTPSSRAPRPAATLPGEPLFAPRSDRPTWGAMAGVVGLSSVVAFGIVVVLGLLLART